MDVKLTMLTVEDLIWDKQWDDAFEFVKTLIQKGVPSGAPLVTRLVKLTKWYDQGLALLKLKKDDIPEYMENYLKIYNLQQMEKSRLSLWTKIPGPPLATDSPCMTESEPSDEEFEESDEEFESDQEETDPEKPLVEILETEILEQNGITVSSPDQENYDVQIEKSTS